MLSDPVALALRRALLVGGAVGASMVAHLLTSDAISIGPGAVMIWACAVSAATIIGPHWAAFRPRSIGSTLVLVVAAQALAHLAMWSAPWAFGFTVHHDHALVSAGAVASHLVATALIVGAVRSAERFVARTLGVIAGARRGRVPIAPASVPRDAERPAVSLPLPRPAARARRPRGPPVTA